jgi:hypothetical protein
MRRAFLALVACYRPSELAAIAPDAMADAAPPTSYDLLVLADAPLAYWPMTEMTGPTLRDLVHNTLTTASGDCRFGTFGELPTVGIRFASKSCAIDVGSDFGFVGHHAFSLEAWSRFDINETTPNREVFGRETRTGSASNSMPVDGYGLVYQDGSNVFAERVINNNITTAKAVAVTADAHHLVVTYDGSLLLLYVDGVAVGQAGDSNAAASTDASAQIGAVAGTSHFSGVMNRVAVYDQVLGAATVTAHFCAGR